MRAWDVELEASCRALVERICGTGSTSERDAAWQQLLVHVGPRVEAWAAASSTLRRAGLTGEDEPRAVLVEVLDRLSDRDFANLRTYLARQAPEPAEADEVELVDQLVRVASETESEVAPTEDATVETPLRGWLIVLTKFAVKEHVKRRLGARRSDGPSKRGLGSGAERLDGLPEIGERPPLSTLLGLRRALAEINATIDDFPDPMPRALRLWMQDAGFQTIAQELALPGPGEAQALVRAAQARLRERFRGAWPELFGQT